MAVPLTASQFLKALQAEGVRLCQDCLGAGWEKHNRGPLARNVYGIVNHHTASNVTPTGLIRKGRPDLRGPLSMAHMTRDGVIHLVGYGRCNHAGRCDKGVLAAMGAGRPAPRPRRDEADFNGHTYSIEVNGTDDGQPFTAAMTDNLARFNAAICRAHGWNAHHVIGHREATLRKPTDPAGIDMNTLRALVLARLAAGATPRRTMTVRAGMTLSGIAAALGVSLAALLGVNPQIVDPGVIHPGQEIVVPGPPVPPVIVTPPPAVKPATPVTVRQGDRGETVRQLQHKLRAHGHKVAVDGDFGPATKAAVVRHQRAWRLSVDGIVGPVTWRTLLTR